MRTTIDSAGRIVIPRALRERAGLRPGTEIEISFRDGVIEIQPAPIRSTLVYEGGFLVIMPESPLPSLTSEDIVRVRESIWEERARDIMDPPP